MVGKKLNLKNGRPPYPSGDWIRSVNYARWASRRATIGRNLRIRSYRAIPRKLRRHPHWSRCGSGRIFLICLHSLSGRSSTCRDAFFAAKVLGARGALLSILVHFFEHGRWGSPAQVSAKAQSLTAEDQLFVLMQAGLYLTLTRGLGAPEARICYEHAEPLCHSLNRPLLLYSGLTGQWVFSLVTEKLSATMQIAKRVYLLAQEQHDSALMIGGCRALAVTLYFLGDFEAARQYAMRGLQIWRSGDIHSPVEEFIAPAVHCLVFEALSDWHFGETARCHATMAEAVSLAKELNDMHALGFWCKFY